jgi:hypothetical protein
MNFNMKCMRGSKEHKEIENIFFIRAHRKIQAFKEILKNIVYMEY